jgi:hypothetical protein
MYVQSNIVARSRNVYASLAVLTAWYHFTRREHGDGDLMSPATVKTCLVIRVKCPIVLPDFNQIRSSSTDFDKRHQYQILRKSVQSEPRWYMRADRRTSRS